MVLSTIYLFFSPCSLGKLFNFKSVFQVWVGFLKWIEPSTIPDRKPPFFFGDHSKDTFCRSLCSKMKVDGGAVFFFQRGQKGVGVSEVSVVTCL